MKTRSERIPFHHPEPPLQLIINDLLHLSIDNAINPEITLWLSFIAAVVEARSRPAGYTIAAAAARVAQSQNLQHRPEESPVVEAAYTSATPQKRDSRLAQNMHGLFVQTALQLNLRSWEQVEGVLCGFVYDAVLLRGELRKLMQVSIVDR